MPFADFAAAVYRGGFRAGRKHAGIGAEPHGAAQVAVLATDFPRAVLVPFRHQPDHGFAFGIQFRAAGVFNAGYVAHGFDYRHLHAETNAEPGNAVFPGIADGGNFAFGAAAAETSRHQNAADVRKMFGGAVFFHVFGIHPFDFDFETVGNAAVGERFV